MKRKYIAPNDRIIVALDVKSFAEARPIIEELALRVGYFKVGLALINSGQALQTLQHIQRFGGRVMYDGKFDDIPNTMADATDAIVTTDVIKMFTVHASSGIASMRAAVEHRRNAEVIAVTVLTSLTDDDSLRIFGARAKEKVYQFAMDAALAGCQCIVCAPTDLKLLGEDHELDSLKRITPGVRPAWASTGDQKRVMTPAEAVESGADFLVIGRPITNPPASIGEPIDAVARIAEEIDSVR